MNTIKLHRASRFSRTQKACLAASAMLGLGLLMTSGAQAQTAAPGAAPAADSQALLAKADADKDGRVSKDEAKMLPAVASRFTELDKDKDGYLNSQEFSAAVKPDAMK